MGETSIALKRLIMALVLIISYMLRAGNISWEFVILQDWIFNPHPICSSGDEIIVEVTHTNTRVIPATEVLGQHGVQFLTVTVCDAKYAGQG